jgi:hypothetical protein
VREQYWLADRFDEHRAHAAIRRAAAVAGRALMFTRPDATVHPALVNGAAGVVVTTAGRPVSVMGFTVRDGMIVAIDASGGRPLRVPPSQGLAGAGRRGGMWLWSLPLERRSGSVSCGSTRRRCAAS